MKNSNFIPKSFLFIVILLSWHIAAQLGIWSSYVLPSPCRVVETAGNMLLKGELLSALEVSFRRVLIGFGTSVLLAFLISFLFVLHPAVRTALDGLFSMLRHIPPISLIPLLILWFGIGETPKIIVIVMASFFPILLNIDAGLSGCDKKLLEVGKILGFSKTKQLKSIMLPYALPHILVGMRIGLGYSLRAIIGAEMVAAANGLGYLILDSQAMSRSDKVIVGIIFIGLLGLIIDKAFSLLIKHLVPYSQELRK
jgi:sulfonate transport system permease protein